MNYPVASVGVLNPCNAINAESNSMYEIFYSEDVTDDISRVRANQRSKILDQIELQLRYEPNRETRNRKILVGLIPPWEYAEPVWELKIDEYRIFYDIDEPSSSVIIRAIRYKPSHKTTEEIL
jgi:mRNA-degrading endonuclease RelE of RelBE toxin-antitoxin system